ncbi:deoxyribose-phosphate aldolase [Alkalicoccobacillus porphyridii]|uniref:Deoxyribose-phosphate aldolase n=1 Tax=Alkalicoccobacillus porphyridii TaxID=2597270 RepID=A0A554A4B7_9BACI|nr:deoxyribose-phosphate aldolase [Alkalicoccobacillus porphyridii]TSB48516.1 deoxyribose-phosphate aldolase [Alkalicoccobacillus porphyridii]
MNQLIDHTVLKADTTRQMVQQVCEEAIRYSFASVCINPYFVPLAKELLKDSSVKVCTVIGFPLGANQTNVKLYEAEQALSDGADELDYVINVSAVKDGEWEQIKDEMVQFASLKVKNAELCIKIILETCYLTNKDIQIASELAKAAGLDFVKTSTGFGTAGATVEHVQLMRKAVGPTIGVKASGGIRSLEDATAMVEAGATRLGCSSGVAIAEGSKQLSKDAY